jgi:hypothetical protein
MSTTGLLITNAGAAAILADLSGGTNLVLSHVGWGDANGVPYNPVATQTALVREKYRATIASMAVVDGAIVVDAILPADTNDASARPSHGFNVSECGLFATDGTMIGVARMGNGFKPAPASGQAVTATYRLKLAVANPSAITVQIDAAQQIHLGRMVRPFFLAIDGVLNAPPALPASGASYVIGAAPTGAWTGFAHSLAQWVGVWVITPAPVGHVVVDNSVSEGSASRYLRRTAGGWASAAATDSAYGVAREATADEVLGRAAVPAYVTPGGLATLAQLQPLFPEIEAAGAVLTFSHASGSLVVGAAGQTWVHRGLRRFGIDQILLADRTFATVANKTYHVRWHAPGTGTATPAATYPNGRFELADLTGASPAEGDPSYDTTFDRMLVARVVTNGSNVATITALLNRARLDVLFNSTGSSTSYGSRSSVPRITGSVNWSRQVKWRIEMADADVGVDNEALATFGVWPLTSQQGRYAVDYAVIGYLSTGNYMKPHAILRGEA